MPSPSSFSLSPIHPHAHTSAIAISAIGTAIGLRALQAPAAFAAAWGLSSQSQSPFVLVLGGRNLALGLLLSTFSYQGNLKSFGTVLVCSVATAGVDGYVTWKYGDRNKVSGHLVPAVVLGGFGAWLLSWK